MPELFEIWGTVKLNTSQFEGKIKQARRDALSLKEHIDKLAGSRIDLSDLIVGNTSGNVIADVIRLVVEVTKKLVSLGIEATKTGAKFEQTVEALTAVSGGAQVAKKDLASLDALAKNTAGLRLVAAEEGYQRLRSLGFESTRAKNLIKELSEEKILSGVSDENLERVIFNFTQIASGGQKVSQEIRELLTAMPSLKKSFAEAFGTLDPKKIQDVVNSNPDIFFDKLIGAMQKTQAASGGLGDSYSKFLDEYTRSERTFSKPVTEPATRLFERMTKALADNQDVIASWGDTAANIITLVSNLADSRLARLAFLLGDVGTKFTLLNGLGEINDKGNKFLSNLDPNDKELERYYQRIEERENVAALKQAEIEEKKRLEIERINTLSRERIDSSQKAGLAGLENTYKTHASRIKSAVAQSYEEEYRQQSQAYYLEQDYLKRRYEMLYKFYQDKYRLAESDSDRFNINSEASAELGGVTSQYRANQAQAKFAEEQLRIKEAERQRSARIEKQNLAVSGSETRQDLSLTYLNEQLDKRKISLEKYQIDSTKIVNDTYKNINDASQKGLSEELAKIGLQEDEKQNIRFRYNQAQIVRNFEHRQKITAINDKTEDETIRRVEKSLSRQTDLQEQFFQQAETRFQIASAYFASGGINISQSIEAINKELGELTGKGIVKSDIRIQGLEQLTALLEGSNGKTLEKLELDILTSSNALQMKLLASRRESLNKQLAEYQKYGKDTGEIEHELTQITNQETQARLVFQLGYFQKYSQTLEGIKEQLAGIRSGNPQITAEFKNNAEKDIAQEQTSLWQESVYWQEKVAVAGEDAAARYSIAWNKAIFGIKDADIQAVESMIASKARLSDMTVYHADQVNARLLETLANQKSLSEILGDAQAGAIEGAFGGIDAGVSRLVESLGLAKTAMGAFIEETLAGLAKLAVSKLIGWLVGAVGGAIGGGVNGAAGGAFFSGGGANIGMAAGGLVSGGVVGKDSVPAMLMPREYVNTADSVNYYGADFFEALNQKLIPKDFFSPKRFAVGGLGSGATIQPMPVSVPLTNNKNVDEARVQRNGGSGGVTIIQHNTFVPHPTTGKYSQPSMQQTANQFASAQAKAVKRR